MTIGSIVAQIPQGFYRVNIKHRYHNPLSTSVNKALINSISNSLTMALRYRCTFRRKSSQFEWSLEPSCNGIRGIITCARGIIFNALNNKMFKIVIWHVYVPVLRVKRMKNRKLHLECSETSSRNHSLMLIFSTCKIIFSFYRNILR